MTNILKKKLKQSLRINSKEVKSLTNDQIIKLSKTKMNIKDSKVKVIRNPIREEPGTYNVILGVCSEGVEYEEFPISVIVINQKKYLWILMSVIAFVMIISGFIWYKNIPTKVSSGLPIATNEKMSGSELKKYAEKKVDQSNVTLQVYPYINIQKDGKTGTMFVQNLPINKTGQVAILKDKSTGDVIYTSGLLKPGYQVSKIKLNKKLSKGDHNGLITLKFYDLKKEINVGKTNVAVEIHVD